MTNEVRLRRPHGNRRLRRRSQGHSSGRGARVIRSAIDRAGPYDDIRGQMSAELPFLNSVYGDNHDRAFMAPLDRRQFVADAVSRGIAAETANRLFALATGPDDLCNAVLDNHELEGIALANACISQKRGTLEKFVSRSFPKVGSIDLASLALSKFSKPQEFYLRAHPLWHFIAREPLGPARLRERNSRPIFSAQQGDYPAKLRSLHQRLRRSAFRVNVLAPGYLATELNSDFWAGDAGKAMLKRSLGDLKELDGPLLLASDFFAYMTGSVIEVDGPGQHAVTARALTGECQ